MLEILGILGIGWGIKKAADGVQSATNTATRKATRAVTNAGQAALRHLDERGPYHPLERDKRAGLCAHRDETIHDDGTYVEVRCKKCGRTAKGCA
jgi:hypothetical protein